MYRNVAGQKIILLAIDVANNIPKTGDAANLTCYYSADYGAATALTDGTATEIDATNMPGLYAFDLTQGETDYHAIEYSGISTTTDVKIVPKCVYTVLETPDVNLIEVGGTAIPVSNVAGVLVVDTGYIDGEAATLGTGSLLTLENLNEDTITLPGQEAPPATPTFFEAVVWNYKLARNKKTQTASEFKVFADNGTTVDHKSTTSDDGTTFTAGELGAGP